MTSNGVASGGVQAAPGVHNERVAERAALRKNDDVQERTAEQTPPMTQPEQIPAQAYNGKGKLVPSPALSAIDLSL